MRLKNLQRFLVAVGTCACVGPTLAANDSGSDPIASPSWAAVLAPAGNQPAIGSSPQVRYNSSFERYKPFTDEAVGDWKNLNKTVEEIGGWKAYAKEARDTAPSAAPSDQSAPGGTP